MVGPDLSNASAAWAFFRRIGSPRYVCAPMVEGSELAFRMMTRSLGAQLCVSPMLHAATFARCKTYRAKNFTTCPEDRPLGVQFASHDPQELLQASLFIQDQCDFVDINLGCPQKIAKRGNYGAFLLKDRNTIEAMVRILAENLSVPVTCKIRLLDTIEETVSLARLLQRSGCSMLTVHGRRKENVGENVGACDWDAIRMIKESVDIPVVANGGIGRFEDIDECLRVTGADAVMASEGLLANPALFYSPGTSTSLTASIALAKLYMEFARKHDATRAQVTLHVVKLLFKAVQGCPPLRDRLCNRPNRSVDTIDEAVAFLAGLDDDIHRQIDAAIPDWYMRHRVPFTTVVEGRSAPEQRPAQAQCSTTT
ncbi:tRNA-dihydrouridine(16/17) synthase [NAD(P)(+)] [Plasmodiophora brassicae]